MLSNDNKRVRITVLLDDETLSAIREYGYAINGTTNVSKAIMLMVKDNGQAKEKTTCKISVTEDRKHLK